MRRICFFITALFFISSAVSAEITKSLLSFDDLDGWAEDDHSSALKVFKETCGDLRDETWAPICTVAKSNPNPKLFFETFFQPVMIEDGKPGLFTGYFEPQLKGSLVQTSRYDTPLYTYPKDWPAGQSLPSRQSIENGALDGRELELVWVDDPVAAFFLQIQGSGRVKLTNGRSMRLGYGGANGFPYRSIGQEMVRRGIMENHQVSAQGISKWVKRNPELGRELLWHNPSYVFFRKVDQVPAEKGPLGAMNRSISKMRSVAVDPAFVKLGAPVWIEKGGRKPIHRLMVAQDTGSAIKGAQRADIFYGTGDEAGKEAGTVKDPGRLVVLLPVEAAFKKVASR